MFCCKGFEGHATAWTTCTAGDITILSNWKNGTSSPTSFTQPGDTWIVNLVMTISSTGTWVVGTAAATPVTIIFDSSGIIQNATGIGGTATITIYGDVIMRGGSISQGGTGTTENVNIFGNITMSAGVLTVCGTTDTGNMSVYGNITMSSGSISTVGSMPVFTINTYGNYTMYGGFVTSMSSSNGRLTMNTHGNFNMIGGVIRVIGSSSVMTNNIYGNCSFSGTAAMTTSIGGTNVVHLALPGTSGTMLIDNTSTGTWSGANIFVDAGCTAQLDDNFSTSTDTSITPGAYGLTVNGTLICPPVYAANGTGIFTLSSGATLEVANAAGINGNITTTGTKTFSTNANYVFNGSVAQVTGYYLPATLVAPDTITINNSAGVTLTQTTSTTGTLLFTGGILHTGTNTMSTPGIAVAVTGAGAASYVDGTLIKTISGLSAVNFEVGNVDYAPMNLAFSAAGTGGSFGIKVTHGLHPGIGASGILTANIVNHYWTITNYSAAGPATVTPRVTYNLSDIIGGSNISFVTQEYTGAAWLGSSLATTNTSAPYTSATGTGIPLGTLPGDYIFGNGCGTPITGTTTVCAGSITHLSDAMPGGTWSSSNMAVATVSGTGLVTGLSPGSAIIFYTTASCSISVVVNVGTPPIIGASTVCSGSTIPLSNAMPGGIWSSSNTAIATVSATGVVTGISPGVVNLSYTLGSCSPVGLAVTVASLSAITDVTTLCNGVTTTLSNATPGGVWSSNNTLVAIVSGSGVVAGVSGGTANIFYTLGSCSVGVAVSVIMTVPIAGIADVCTGSAIMLSDITSGGVWSSNNTLVATVSGTGVVSGIAAGSAAISYTAGGCSVNIPVTVNPSGAGTITGRDSVCIGTGNTITLSDAVSCRCGGWSSTDTSLATVTAATGVVTGVSAGVDTIKYMVTNSCGTFMATFVVQVLTAGQCTTGIYQATTEQLTGLKIFPNPNEGTFTVNLLSVADEEVHVVITNIVGEKVIEFITTTNKAVEIKLDPAAGIYLLSASTSHGRYISKIVVE
ncbi:MAG: Ig-like domain-containing protein [Chitinophagales bacterium]